MNRGKSGQPPLSGRWRAWDDLCCYGVAQIYKVSLSARVQEEAEGIGGERGRRERIAPQPPSPPVALISAANNTVVHCRLSRQRDRLPACQFP